MAPTSSSPAGWRTHRCSSPRSCTSIGWAWDDWDRLAAGVTVGHLLECSGQVTGGNYSGAWWDMATSPTRVASRSPSVDADGTAVITKPDGTGGLVSFDTVREQLMYEVHDPSAYLNPDVTSPTSPRCA